MPAKESAPPQRGATAAAKAAGGKREGGIQSIRRACELLEIVARSPDGIGPADLSRAGQIRNRSA